MPTPRSAQPRGEPVEAARPTVPGLVSINTASASELAAIRGLREVNAKAVVAYREQLQVTLGTAAEAPAGAAARHAKH